MSWQFIALLALLSTHGACAQFPTVPTIPATTIPTIPPTTIPTIVTTIPTVPTVPTTTGGGSSSGGAGSLNVYNDLNCQQLSSSNAFNAGDSFCYTYSFQGADFSQSYSCASGGAITYYNVASCSGLSAGSSPFSPGQCLPGAPSAAGTPSNYVMLSCASSGGSTASGGSTTSGGGSSGGNNPQTVYVYSDAACSQQTASMPMSAAQYCYGWSTNVAGVSIPFSAQISCPGKTDSTVAPYSDSLSCTAAVSTPGVPYPQGTCIPLGTSSGVDVKYVKVDCGSGLEVGKATSSAPTQATATIAFFLSAAFAVGMLVM